MFSGHTLVAQAPVLDGSLLDFGPPFEVADALMVSAVVGMVDEILDFGFQVAGQEIVFQQEAVFQSLVPALDLALGLGGERRGHGLCPCLPASSAFPSVTTTSQKSSNPQSAAPAP